MKERQKTRTVRSGREKLMNCGYNKWHDIAWWPKEYLGGVGGEDRYYAANLSCLKTGKTEKQFVFYPWGNLKALRGASKGIFWNISGWKRILDLQKARPSVYHCGDMGIIWKEINLFIPLAEMTHYIHIHFYKLIADRCCRWSESSNPFNPCGPMIKVPIRIPRSINVFQNNFISRNENVRARSVRSLSALKMPCISICARCGSGNLQSNSVSFYISSSNGSCSLFPKSIKLNWYGPSVIKS